MKQIDEYLKSLPEWKRKNLELFRKLVHELEPSVIEDWKWSVPVFMINGKMYFAMSAFKEHTKYNFMINGALIKDSKMLFNNGFDSKKSRGIDLREDQTINESDLKDLIKLSVNN